MTDLTSIVIPCYNARNTVARAVKSALGQTHDAIEVIVVDDGSTDGSHNELSKFQKDIKIVRVPNGGGGAARNIGVAKANGRYVQFLDADDVLLPEKVARGIAAAQELDEHEIPISDWTLRQSRKDGLQQRRAFNATADRGFEAVLRETLAISAPLHRKSQLLSVNGFREHLPCCQEKDLHIRMYVEGMRFVRDPFEGVTIFETPGSVSSNSTKVLLQRREVFQNTANVLSEANVNFEWKEVLACALVADAFDLIKLGCSGAHHENLVLASKLDETQGYASCIRNRALRLWAKTVGVNSAASLYALSKRLGQ